MKKLTNFTLVIFALLLAIQSNAQTFGVRAGLNLAKQLNKDDDETYSDDFDNLIGFHVGLIVEMSISEMLSVESGLMLTTQGFKIEDEEFGATLEAKGTLYYVDIPLTVKAAFEINDGMDIYGIAGPYVGFGVSGKLKSTVEFMGDKETEEDDVEWGSDDEDDLKRLDYGLTIGAGIEMNAIQIGLAYDLGLANIIAGDTDDGEKINNRAIRLTVGYFFGR